MKIRRLLKDKTAIAGVLEAILLVGLVAIILALLQLNYIPDIMKDREAEHMDEVTNQFSHLKSVIEMQSTMGVINKDNPPPKHIAYTSISSPITMGSKELPYMVSSRAYGQIQLIDRYKAGFYKINIQPAPPQLTEFPTGEIPLTSIKYDAMNSYFTDQTYVLEGGGIILKQPDGETMRVQPAMNIVNKSNQIEINWNVPLFRGIAGKNITGGYKQGYVRTNYTNHWDDEVTLTPGDFIYIYTNYPIAWNKSLINESGLLWEYNENNYISITVNEGITPNRVEIKPSSKNILLKITVVEIGVQIGAGMVISSN